MDLDIDEVSLVDRGANQHSVVAFSKSLTEENPMSDVAVYSEAGEEVDVDTLEHGDTVFDADGNEYVFVADEVVEEQEVGKADVLRTASVMGRRNARKGIDAGAKWARKNPGKAAAGAAGALGAAAGAGYAVNKSFQEEILEEFSKALTDRDREQVVAKMADEVAKAYQMAEEANAWAAAEHDARLEEAYISKAAEYNLPVAPGVLGPILKAVAEVLDEDQLQVLDDLFNAVGDTLYNEIGYVGESDNASVLDQVNALAAEYVGKSDVSREQATTAMFEANPEAYDAYLREMGR